MTLSPPSAPTLTALDSATSALVGLAATLMVGDELAMREALVGANGLVPHPWIEELILQSYLFAGFPRALNAAREWRRVSGSPAPEGDAESDFARAGEWRRRGEETCAIVYGEFYEALRDNINRLHPALDEWMIVEGYGKVLSRPALDLKRRELCVVAACAAARQSRQLHSHLHGALNSGATREEVTSALAAADRWLSDGDRRAYAMLWARVRRD